MKSVFFLLDKFLRVPKQSISLSEEISDEHCKFTLYKVSYIALEYCYP